MFFLFPQERCTDNRCPSHVLLFYDHFFVFQMTFQEDHCECLSFSAIVSNVRQSPSLFQRQTLCHAYFHFIFVVQYF